MSGSTRLKIYSLGKMNKKGIMWSKIITAVLVLIVVAVSIYGLLSFITNTTNGSLLKALLGEDNTVKGNVATKEVQNLINTEFSKFNQNNKCYTLMKSNTLLYDMTFEEKNGKIEQKYSINNQEFVKTIDASDLYFFYPTSYQTAINPNEKHVTKLTLEPKTINDIRIEADGYKINSGNWYQEVGSYIGTIIPNLGISDETKSKYLLFIKYDDKFGLYSYPINNKEISIKFGNENLPICDSNNDLIKKAKEGDNSAITQILLNRYEAITTDPSQKSKDYYIDKKDLFEETNFVFNDDSYALQFFDTYHYGKILNMEKGEYLRRCTKLNLLGNKKCLIAKPHFQKLKDSNKLYELPSDIEQNPNQYKDLIKTSKELYYKYNNKDHKDGYDLDSNENARLELLFNNFKKTISKPVSETCYYLFKDYMTPNLLIQKNQGEINELEPQGIPTSTIEFDSLNIKDESTNVYESNFDEFLMISNENPNIKINLVDNNQISLNNLKITSKNNYIITLLNNKVNANSNSLLIINKKDYKLRFLYNEINNKIDDVLSLENPSIRYNDKIIPKCNK